MNNFPESGGSEGSDEKLKAYLNGLNPGLGEKFLEQANLKGVSLTLYFRAIMKTLAENPELLNMSPTFTTEDLLAEADQIRIRTEDELYRSGGEE